LGVLYGKKCQLVSTEYRNFLKIFYYPIYPFCCHSVINLIQIVKIVKKYRELGGVSKNDSTRKVLSFAVTAVTRIAAK
jgi:hypothetical protein